MLQFAELIYWTADQCNSFLEEPFQVDPFTEICAKEDEKVFSIKFHAVTLMLVYSSCDNIVRDFVRKAKTRFNFQF